MRENKFRIRRDILDTFDKYIATEWQYFTAVDGCMDVDNCYMDTIGQYTGLKDKNGVEIYEGDITDEGEVVYGKIGFDNKHNGLSGFVLKEWKTDDFYELNWFFDYKDLKVIGNIHEEGNNDKT